MSELSLSLFEKNRASRSGSSFFLRSARIAEVNVVNCFPSLPLLLPLNPHLQARVRSQALLAQQPLRLPVELLDHLAGEQARRLDLHPAADAEPHQAELERRGLVGGPSGRGGEVPPVFEVRVEQRHRSVETW